MPENALHRPDPPPPFSPDENCARELDAADPLAGYRRQFHVPRCKDGSSAVYFAGNSLGLQPKSVRAVLDEELKAWAELAVDGHFEGGRPWYTYNELFRESGARLVGALPGEVVMMNSLTVNLHLLMVSFYRPTAERYKILVEDPCFPSDTYAVKAQLRYHGIDPSEGLVAVRPRPGEHCLSMEDIETALQQQGGQIALMMLGGVNFATGQVFDMARITAAGHRCGCTVGFDLAHAAGNIPLRLHDWGVDFAAWCNYKYLNAGPGAVAACFVHQRHGGNLDLPRFAGWWGNDPATRFRMQLLPEFVPREGAYGWQASNPPILALAPVKASYEMFDEAGMGALRAKSKRLTGYLEYLIDELSPARAQIVTPPDPEQRGCQLSLLVHDRPRELLGALHDEGVICDFREPNIIRAAPTPLYNTFHDVWRFAQVLARHDRGAA